ncbi:uncharacterized protein LOC118192776 [Stegodyphus dumicola]|uniref:uncharacterized protein LOC118192776 n=1 Tax=Stegodyphus dumicola TaxID=202533 RepID=UPI0015ACDFF6|nr:uncharacterized protein LOC118192776 [Stegodyphus dumicola]
MIGSMLENETDISGPYFITKPRADVVAFSTPFAFSELAIVSGLVPANKDPFVIFEVFSWQVWLLIVSTLILIAIVATFTYMILPAREKRMKAEVFLEFLWRLYGSFMWEDIGSPQKWLYFHIWSSVSFRMLLSLWLLGPVLIIMYSYQGVITSKFASDKLIPRIQNMDQLFRDTGVKICTLQNSYPLDCFKALVVH